MKNKRLTLIALILILFLVVSVGCSYNGGNIDLEQDNNDSNLLGANGKGYSTLIVDDYNNIDTESLNHYIIDVEFNPEEKTYTGLQHVIYTNNEEVSLEELYFHIYPNTFRTKETSPFLFDSFEEAFPNGYQPGYIDINKVSIDEKIIKDYSIEGKGKTMLKIPLDKSLEQGEKIDIYMEYKAQLPPAEDRFGYGDKTFNLGNWYPIAAVYDADGWNLDPYYKIGDPFYSDTSNYDVTIIAPKELIIASSGNILSEDKINNKKVWKIEAKLMRDFAWVASSHFTMTQKNIDGTLVKVYFLNDDEKANNFAAEASYKSIEIFNEVFGKYPFGQYSVVATSFQTGMEYPGIVFIGEQYYDALSLGYLEIVIAHETGHQWWYSVVGNDEIDEAWLDESLTTYSEVVYADKKYSEEVGDNYYVNSIENGYEYKKDMLQENTSVVKPLADFENWDDYGALAYNRGAMFIRQIEEIYGEKVLYDIFKEYYNRFRFLNATTEDFITVCEDITGQSFDSLVNEWLYVRKD